MTIQIVKSARRGYPPWQKPLRGTLIDPTHPLSKNLVRCWVFNEGGGNIVDLVTGIHDTIGANGPTWSQGIRGPGLKFGGTTSTSRIDLGNDLSLSGTSPMSIAFGMQNTRAVNAASQRVIQQRNGGYDGEFLLGVNNGNAQRVYWGIYNGGWEFQYESASGTFPADNSYHSSVCTRIGNGTGHIYIDGREPSYATSSAGTPKSLVASLNQFIGYDGRPTVSGFLEGTLYYIYIWYGRALTSIEAAWLHKEPYAMFQRSRPYPRKWYKKKLWRIR